MSHPQNFNLFDLFNNEQQPFRKVHRMINLFKAIIKIHTVFIISSYNKNRNTSNDITSLLADGLQILIPKIWNYFGKGIIMEIGKNERGI